MGRKNFRRLHHEIIHAENFCLKENPVDCEDSIKREIDAYYFLHVIDNNPMQCLLDNVIHSMNAYPKYKGLDITGMLKVAIEKFILKPHRA